MGENRVAICHRQGSQYPGKANCFRPEIMYPEFKTCKFQQISGKRNDVYEMVRKCLKLMGYDADHMDTEEWNPLGSIIRPRDHVVLKPNMVMHYNENPAGGVECLYTHPSVVAAVIDYVLLALTSEDGEIEGTVIVGDAPMQECDFDQLVKESGYRALIDYYANVGINIQLVDFRNVRTVTHGGIKIKQSLDRDLGVTVYLDRVSEFEGLSIKRIKNLRITNYNPQILKKHHSENKHEYKVAAEILDADVVINMPKPKTHRKAGVTIALKNLVGMNANKEYLPHHTLGSKKQGGDAYKDPNVFLRVSDTLLDWKNYYMQDERYLTARFLQLSAGVFSRLGKCFGERYREGSWYGNDTIWRTILDLNKIVFYADKDGNMSPQKKRRMLIVADMIVAGEKDGPVAPSPKRSGVIAIGEDPVCFDEIICSLMGIPLSFIPTIVHAREIKQFALTDESCGRIISDDERWNNKTTEEISREDSLGFADNPGWKR